MRPFKFFTDNEPDYLEEVPTISRYDDYDMFVLDKIRYETNPVARVYRFDRGGESKAIIIYNIPPDDILPLMDEVNIEYELYHIELNQPDRVETRHITMPVTEYNEIRYETI